MRQFFLWDEMPLLRLEENPSVVIFAVWDAPGDLEALAKVLRDRGVSTTCTTVGEFLREKFNFCSVNSTFGYGIATFFTPDMDDDGFRRMDAAAEQVKEILVATKLDDALIAHLYRASGRYLKPDTIRKMAMDYLMGRKSSEQDG